MASPVNLRTDKKPRGVSSGGRLMFCTADGIVVSLDVGDGREVWRHDSGATSVTAPEVHGSVVFYGGTNLSARRISDGYVLWTAKARKDYMGQVLTWSTPTVVDGAAFAMCGGRVQRLDPVNGKPAWTDMRSFVSGNSPILLQGSYGWIVDLKFPEVAMIGLNAGYTVLRYQPRNDIMGFAADGNRVFIRTGDQITALPVV